MLDIPKIELYLFFRKKVIAPRYLSKSRKTRAHIGSVMPPMDSLFKFLTECRTFWTWSDK